MEARHIAVSGIIGAGKSTLVRGLSRELGFVSLEERFEENPYLAGFYREPARWAFYSYIFFFQRTLDDYRRVEESVSGGVQERILEEHFWVFGKEFHARGYLQESDLQLLRELTLTSSSMVKRPDLLIYLDIEPEQALSRIRHRGVEAEREISLDYLGSLYRRYEDLLKHWEGNAVTLDATTWDFRKSADVSKLAEWLRGSKMD